MRHKKVCNQENNQVLEAFREWEVGPGEEHVFTVAAEIKEGFWVEAGT